jgi:hypothetical protein
MSRDAATEATLGKLHEKVAKVMLGALETIETAQDIYMDIAVNDPDKAKEFPNPPEVSASLLGAMTKFLADNKITCIPEESKAGSELANKLANRKKAVGNIIPFQSDD